MSAAKANTPALPLGSQDTCGSYGVLTSRAAGRALVGGVGIAASAAGAKPTAMAKATAVQPTVNRRVRTDIDDISPYVADLLLNPLSPEPLSPEPHRHPNPQPV